MRSRSARRSATWQSGLVLVILGIPAAVFANSISDALFSQSPNWLYVLACAILLVSLIQARFLVASTQIIAEQANELDSLRQAADTHLPQPCVPRRTLAECLPLAKHEVMFIGVTSKRTFSDDTLRSLVSSQAVDHVSIRVLLVAPKSKAFADRARDERESAETWKHDQRATVERLKAFHSRYGLSVELRFTNEYPIWRMIIVDQEVAWLGAFLPGKRGTESTQWRIQYPEVDMTYGFIKWAQTLWENAEEVAL